MLFITKGWAWLSGKAALISVALLSLAGMFGFYEKSKAESMKAAREKDKTSAERNRVDQLAATQTALLESGKKGKSNVEKIRNQPGNDFSSFNND